MIVLGVLSVVQMIFLPGFLLLKALRIKLGIFQMLVFSFPLSLLINFFLVWVLTLLHLHIQSVWMVVIILEMIGLTWLIFLTLKYSLEICSAEILVRMNAVTAGLFQRNEVVDGGSSFNRLIRSSLMVILSGAALLSVWWAGQIFFSNLGTVFSSWDAVLSYNSWAVAWAGGSIPEGIGIYPQLLSANWSLSYVLAGSTSVQFFAKAIQPLFFLVTLLLMLKMGWSVKSWGVLFGLLIFRYMVKKFLGEYIAEGYADIATMALSFLAFYSLYEAHQTSQRSMLRIYLFLSAASAAAAALTKQAGGFTLLVLPLLVVLVPFGQTSVSMKEKWSLAAQLFGIGLILAGPWYLYKAVEVWMGLDETNVVYLTSELHDQVPPLMRILPALGDLGKYGLVVGLAAMGALILPRFMRWATLLMGLGYLIVWAVFFSYDIRNISTALPFLALGAGLAVEKIVKIGVHWLDRLRLTRVALGILLALILLSGIGASLAWVSDAELIERQSNLQKQIFAPQFNAGLYEYLEEWRDPQPVRILAKYPVSKLPGLEAMQISYWFDDPQVYQALLRDPDINHILVAGSIPSEEVEADIEAGIEAGQYRVVLESGEFGGMRLIRIR